MTTIAKKYGLKPCPFCDSSNLTIERCISSDSQNSARDIEYIKCLRCGAQGGWHRATKLHIPIIKHWNLRFNPEEGKYEN